MKINNLIRKGLKICFAKRPVYTTANILTLPPGDLLKGRKALITGGTSGIGLAIAKSFLASGAVVCITGRDEAKIKKVREDLENINSDYKNRVFASILDVKDVASFPQKVDEILQSLTEIDILVNNAGVRGGQIATVSETEYDDIMDTNLKGTFFLSKVISSYMIKNNIEGNILNIASASGIRPANSAYTLSKWGVRGLTLGLAKTLIPYGIVVNGIAPGPTATPMLMDNGCKNITHNSNPLKRYALPEEIANMAVILVSMMGKTIVGDIVYMTGGAGLITLDDLNYKI